MDRLLLNTGPVCCETLASTTFLITQLLLPLVLLLRRHSCDLIRHSLWKSILLIQSLSLSPWAFMLFKLGRVENSCIVVDCQRQSSWTQTEHLNLRAEFRSPFAVLDSQLYRGQWTFLFMQRLTRCCLVFESHSLYCRRLFAGPHPLPGHTGHLGEVRLLSGPVLSWPELLTSSSISLFLITPNVRWVLWSNENAYLLTLRGWAMQIVK